MEKITITFEGKSVRQIAGRLALILSGKDKREKISKSVFFEALASHYNFTNEKTLFYWDICKQFEEDFYGEVLEFLLEQETTPGTPKIKAFLLEVGNIEIPNSPDDENNNDNTGKVRDAHEYEDLPLPPMSIPEDGTLPDIRRIAQALSGDLMNAHTVSLLQLKEKAVKYLNERNKARSN